VAAPARAPTPPPTAASMPAPRPSARDCADDCQTALNWDPGSASNRNPSPALEKACPGSEREGPARSGATAKSLA
jgi:hypothetical protein